MSIFRYKLASVNIKTFVIYLDLLFYLVPKHENDIAR